MPVVGAGQPAPEFSLATYEGDRFTRENLLGRITVLVFYPHAFSPICTDQLSVYQEVLEDFEARLSRFRADSELTCLVIPAWEFKASLEEHPQMAIPMLQAIIARLHRTEHHG